MTEFGASQWMVKKSKEIKREKGILSTPGKKLGKALDGQVKHDVKEFYGNDENSRMCPGQKDYVNVVNEDGEKEKVQKRMVLTNLKELHASWKKLNPDKRISFSTFAGLRPKHCILAGAAGTHSVCVCKHHQNPKLMCQVVGLDYKHLIQLTVCDDNKEVCMMRQCKECPGGTGLTIFLEDELDEQDITFNQWLSTDRTTLSTITQSKNDFIQKLVDDIINLSRHSFVSK